MQLCYHVLDVFTDRRLAGNPVAVVLEADALEEARMQAIAREFNLAETVFILKPENPAHTARVRIFTPMTELPFAGHPTVGTGVLLAQLRSPAPARRGDALVVLEEGIGIVRVGVRMAAGAAAFAEFDAPKLPTGSGAAPAVDRLAAALCLIPSEIGFENHRPTRYSAGNPFTFVPVASLDAITKARVAAAEWEAAIQGSTGAFLYCRQTLHTTSAFHARMFAPQLGIPEDPATGSASGPLGAYLVERGLVTPADRVDIVSEQGARMGRPSVLHIRIGMRAGRVSEIRVGGTVVPVIDGRLRLP
jgi:trans-2,3-dihydro-3-hydroxyanthranilate isomerase